MNQYRYKDLQFISEAMSWAYDGDYPPFVRAMRNVVVPFKVGENTFNIPRTLNMGMDTEDPYLHIMDTTNAVEWEGFLSGLKSAKWKEPYESSFEPDALWFLINEGQVISTLEDSCKEGRKKADEALKRLNR